MTRPGIESIDEHCTQWANGLSLVGYYIAYDGEARVLEICNNIQRNNCYTATDFLSLELSK